MEQEFFDAVDEIAEEIEQIVAEVLETSEELDDALRRLEQLLAPDGRVGLETVVNILHGHESQLLRIRKVYVESSNDGCFDASSGTERAKRYLVDGEVLKVPNDHCPRCWGEWAFKLHQPSCRGCGLTLGADCKLVLEKRFFSYFGCPNCNPGLVSESHPVCSRCNRKLDPAIVAWDVSSQSNDILQ